MLNRSKTNVENNGSQMYVAGQASTWKKLLDKLEPWDKKLPGGAGNVVSLLEANHGFSWVPTPTKSFI
jgi:hypothetical protein